jgi:hypothetical protein
MRESRKERRGREMEEGEGHARTQRAPGEKGVFERDTRGMCVSKIITETREEKEERKKKPSGLDGRTEGMEAGQ